MDILKHHIYKSIYELSLEIEKLPASEHQTKLATMCAELEKYADLLYESAYQGQNFAPRIVE